MPLFYFAKNEISCKFYSSSIKIFVYAATNFIDMAAAFSILKGTV
jgi:hypothetical protein